MKLRYCTTPFSKRFLPWSLPRFSRLGASGHLHKRSGDATAHLDALLSKRSQFDGACDGQPWKIVFFGALVSLLCVVLQPPAHCVLSLTVVPPDIYLVRTEWSMLVHPTCVVTSVFAAAMLAAVVCAATAFVSSTLGFNMGGCWFGRDHCRRCLTPRYANVKRPPSRKANFPGRPPQNGVSREPTMRVPLPRSAPKSGPRPQQTPGGGPAYGLQVPWSNSGCAQISQRAWTVG